jgi:TRAP-type C4-dicarboxylate transport system permease small subunit
MITPVLRLFTRIGGWIIVAMMLLTVIDVLGRKFFNRPVYGAYEISEFMLVIVVFFSIVCCESKKGHISIGLVVSRFRRRTQDVIDSIMYLIFLVASCLLTWRLWLYGVTVWRNNLTSGVLQIPIYPVVFLASLGGVLLTLVVFMHFLLFLSGVLRK